MKMRRAWAGVAAVAAAALVGALGAAPVSAYAETVTVKTADELATAINAGNDVVLGDNITASVTVPADKTVTIDLGGHTLTNEAGKHTITNNGTLTITGAGTVDNVSHGKATLFNDGTATIAGGTFTRSAEAGAAGTANGNSWYVVCNNTGTLNMTGGMVSGTSGFSSCLINRDNGTMNFSGGTIEQPDMIALKNEGTLNMTGGSAVSPNDSGLQNWGRATVSAGTIDGTLSNFSYDNTNPGVLDLVGGTVTGDISVVKYNDGKGTVASVAPSVSISGTAKVGGEISATEGGAVSPSKNQYTPEMDESTKISGGTFDSLTVLNYLADSSAVVKTADGYAVKSEEDAKAGSFAEVVLDGTTTIYFDDVDEAKDFAKEAGLTEDDVKVTKYLVTFVANSQTVEVRVVVAGDALGALPEAGEYEGYTFDGWYVDVTEGADGFADGTKIDETYKPTGDVTVTAMWTENAPSAPSTPSTPAAGSTDAQPAEAPKKALPQTGDTTNAALPVAIAIAGIVVIAAAVALRKRHN